jgi:hypothetical protein
MSAHDLRVIAQALGGEVSGRQVRAPGPGHTEKDRSLSVRFDSGAPEGFITNSFAGDAIQREGFEHLVRSAPHASGMSRDFIINQLGRCRHENAGGC